MKSKKEKFFWIRTQCLFYGTDKFLYRHFHQNGVQCDAAVFDVHRRVKNAHFID